MEKVSYKWEYVNNSKRDAIGVILDHGQFVKTGHRSDDECSHPTCCNRESHKKAMLICEAPNLYNALLDLYNDLKPLSKSGIVNEAVYLEAERVLKLVNFEKEEKPDLFKLMGMDSVKPNF